MEDRFKFRVFLKYNQIMCDIDSYCFLQGLNKCVFHFTNGGQKTLKNNDFILMQSTGLKDKNGKLIYEGDIVKTYPSGFFDTYTDIFFIKNNLCGFYLATPYKNMSDDWECQDTIGCYDKKMYEVIGNIYENPELLED